MEHFIEVPNNNKYGIENIRGKTLNFEKEEL